MKQQKQQQQQQKIHQDSIWKQLLHIDEVLAGIYLLTMKPIPKTNLCLDDNNIQNKKDIIINNPQQYHDDLIFCNNILDKIARPYALAIRQLPYQLAIHVIILHHSL